jgi:coenzyme F420-0:L-glutamate ligase/coenzyme F420-1:gamma-L-glutamate ligase
MTSVLAADRRAFIESRRTATWATLSGTGQPRLVPICFVLADPHAEEAARPVLYSPLDEKPKRSRDVRCLARVRDIAERPRVTLLFERWDEDWSHLAWLRASGTASVVGSWEDAEAHRRVVQALRTKYPQYRSQAIDASPLIRVVIDEVVGWSATSGPLQP